MEYELTAASNYTAANLEEMVAVNHVTAVLLLVICAFGLVGNMLSMLVVFRNPLMKTASSIFIFNLALADFLFLLSLPMTATHLLLRTWMFRAFLCRVYYGLFGVNLFASVYTLTAMSFDRFVAICCMSLNDIRTVTNSIIACVFIWITSIMLSLPLMMYAEYEDFDGQCTINWPVKGDEFYHADVYTYYTLSAGFILPCILILAFYLTIVIKINTQKSGLTELALNNKKKRNRRVTCLVLVISAAFVICWLPYWVVQVYVQVSKGILGPGLDTFFHFATILYCCNSALNPLLYGFMSASYRKAIKKMCGYQANNQAADRQTGDGSQSRGLLLGFVTRKKAEGACNAPRSPKTSVRTLKEHVTLVDNGEKLNHNMLTVT